MKLIDLTGQKFGMLLVLERTKNKGEKVAWKCKCDCGNTTIATSSDLKQGNTKSCGCLNHKPCNLRHGHCYNSVYKTYCNMKTRCFNKNDIRYKDYGGRGITVCEEWKNSFQAFYDYVSKLPHFNEKGYSLDRINNDGNYEPDNVRWATAKTQANNRRNSKRKENNYGN